MPPKEALPPGVASRRPDGTYRKERRVREGYTPQEEQPVYTPQAVLARQDVPICPGFDGAPSGEGANAKLSKSQKKNEKRKERAKGGEPAAAATVDAATAGMQRLSTASQQPAPQQQQQQGQQQQQPHKQKQQQPGDAGDASAPSDPPIVRKQKELRALMKKVRQAEGLADKLKLGQQISPEEMEKVSKLPAWSSEVTNLEREVQALRS